MKKFIYLAMIAAATISCAAKKNLASEELIQVPCKEFKTDANTLRANAVAEGPTIQIATDKALTIARASLASTATTLVERVNEMYRSAYDKNQSTDYVGRFQDMTRQISAKLLNNAPQVCDKIVKVTDKDGHVSYRAHVAVEIAREDLEKEIQQEVGEIIKKSDRESIDEAAENYRKIFEQEFSK